MVFTLADFPGHPRNAFRGDSRIGGTTFDSDFKGDFALARYDVKTFNICLQDDSNGNMLRFNSQTGDYQFTLIATRA